MSKKYMSRPYCFGQIPDYTMPPMTVGEYQYYEKEFFGFLEEKQVHKQETEFVQRFLQLIGIPKISKYEDEVTPGDYLKGGTSVNVAKTATKDTQTDQGVHTGKCKGGFLKSCRRFFRRSNALRKMKSTWSKLPVV